MNTVSASRRQKLLLIEMRKITISNISIDLVRKNIKNIHLTISPPTGEVRVSAPVRISDEAIRVFIISKLPWIKRQQQKFVGHTRPSPKEYKNGEYHYFQGMRYLLNVVETNAPPGVMLRDHTCIDLFIRPSTPVSKRREIMIEWYRTQLKQAVPEFIEKWEKKIGISVAEWRIKAMKTRWGSCNIKKKRIWINLELAKKSLPCLEYVIVHELVHLLERRHNGDFYHHMDHFLPNWKQIKQELKNFPMGNEDWSW
jgi:predicted metal-dependent hydrolase